MFSVMKTNGGEKMDLTSIFGNQSSVPNAEM
jgi:hypothetical protein